jgi:hypothetical protein
MSGLLESGHGRAIYEVVGWRNVVPFGSLNRKCGTSWQHGAENDRCPLRKCPYFRGFCGGHFVDMVGVTGSIPVAPTIRKHDGTDLCGSAL